MATRNDPVFYRFGKPVIVIFALLTLFLYNTLPASSPVKACGLNISDPFDREGYTYRTVGYSLAIAYNYPGKVVLSSDVGTSIARFFEHNKNIPCSSPATIAFSFAFWLFALYAWVFYKGKVIKDKDSKNTHSIDPFPKNSSAVTTAPVIKARPVSTPDAANSMLPTSLVLEQSQKAHFADEMRVLSQLTGLSSVKDELNAVISLESVNARRRTENLKELRTSRHLVFTGNPGTGKTTVARLLGRIYSASGVLRSGHLVETDRAGLVHEHIGGTAILTLRKIQEARGGILFIDEAYTLYRSDSPRDTGKEAIDTLLKAMEDFRDDLCVIVAGYTQEMSVFLSSNPGLQSRFTKIIEFPDYSADELFTIFRQMLADKGLEMTDGELNAVARILNESHASGITRRGNGRFVRNLVDAAIERQAVRISQMPDASLKILTIEDFELGRARLGRG